MRKVKAVIERASDGNYSVYMDADDMGYLVTGTGKTEDEAIDTFLKGYEDTKAYYAEQNKPFQEIIFIFVRDIWHSKDEKPESDRELLIKTSFGGHIVNKAYYPWIEEWCYIDDLKPVGDG